MDLGTDAQIFTELVPQTSTQQNICRTCKPFHRQSGRAISPRSTRGTELRKTRVAR